MILPRREVCRPKPRPIGNAQAAPGRALPCSSPLARQFLTGKCKDVTHFIEDDIRVSIARPRFEPDNFAENEKRGQGTFTWPNGAKYVGAFRDGTANGEGTEYGTDGKAVRAGLWANGEFVGDGESAAGE